MGMVWCVQIIIYSMGSDALLDRVAREVFGVCVLLLLFLGFLG